MWIRKKMARNNRRLSVSRIDKWPQPSSRSIVPTEKKCRPSANINEAMPLMPFFAYSIGNLSYGLFCCHLHQSACLLRLSFCIDSQSIVMSQNRFRRVVDAWKIKRRGLITCDLFQRESSKGGNDSKTYNFARILLSSLRRRHSLFNIIHNILITLKIKRNNSFDCIWEYQTRTNLIIYGWAV